MKKFEVYFFSEDKGSFENQKIHAETQEDAFNKFLIGKHPNNYKIVVVDSDGFLDSFSISAKSFPNPLCILDGIEGKSILNTGTGVETEADVIVNSTRQNEILLKILETQEKQLGWIRIIALPVLLSIIFFFLRILTGHN